MSQMVVEHTLASVLSRADGPTEIRDPDGHLVGIFTPAIEEDFDFAEADRVLREEGHLGITTAELIAHLHSLEI